jgi:outer membrane protein TolC
LASASGIFLLKNQLFTEIADLYYQLISLDKKLAIYQKNYAIQEVAFDIIYSQRETGKATELAVQQFGSQLKEIKADIEQIKMDVFTTEKAISTLLGDYGGAIARSSNFINSHVQLLNQAIPVDSIIHKRPDVQSSFYELEASKANAKAIRAAFFPTLKIGGYGAMNSFSLSTFFNPASLAWQILGGLTAPIFNQGQLKQNFYVANREQEIAFFTYQKNVINAYNELSSLLFQVDKYKEVLRYKTEEYEMLNRAVEVSNDLYLTGYANYLEIINSQKLKLQSEIDLVDYQLRNAKSFVQLYKALGGEL